MNYSTVGLVLPGTYQATKLTTKSDHVQNLTSNWTEMTTKLDHKAVLRLLRSGDVASNELYYHNICYDTIRYQCRIITKSESDLKDSEMSSPGNLYPVTELETMYYNLLKSDNIHRNNHTTSLTYW